MNVSPGKKKWSAYAGILVSVALLGIVLYQVDHIDFAATLGRLGFLPFAIAVGGYLIAFCAVAWRFGRAAGRFTLQPVSAGAVASTYLPIILATNLLAHGISIGAELARLLFLKRVHQLDVQTSVTLVLVDRLVGVGVVFAFAIYYAIGVYWSAAIELRLIALVGVTIAGVAATVAAVKLAPQMLVGRFQGLRRIIAVYLASPRLIVEQVLVSFVALCGLALALFSISRSLGADIPFGVALASVPIIYLGSSVPFTYAGWGSRELACIAVLAWTGWMSTADALAVSVTLGIAAFVASLPGLVSIRQRER